MTTTGELRAIVEELELVDAGEAASYLGEDIPGKDAGSDITALTSCLSDIALADEHYFQLC
ncbi:hypothetical protein [Dictyobacter arantiisoli]|uniref:Uncharacterized protein n=1 Tax=Dictyobacter arantiisoli TaxID=2014874 RepID=A0A5A5TAG5_9CHLR|nr:hypothetical protein [Dictyobacter arantiisoli]GCF08146.1 hypothetical protein KDI_17100 [Dictyobacter arantiisoli]